MEMNWNSVLEDVNKRKKDLHFEILEAWIDWCAMYSRKYWLILLNEKLKRLETEY